jgi:hypothetical protein
MQAIDLARGGLTLSDEARNKLDAQATKIAKRDHPMLTALDNAEIARDVADIQRYLSDIIRVLTEARIGVD